MFIFPHFIGIPFVQRILQNGWFASVCKIDPQTDWEEDLPIFTNVWAILFAFSKILEFGDTIFIVLRKQKLIFLHWYHHTTVTLYVWFFFANSTSTFLWHMAMNYFMHTFMYSYYAIRAIGSYRPPKWINMTLTSMQLIQMVVGIFINSYVLLNALMDHTFYCDGRVEVNLANPILAVALYTSYLILFATFFWSTYLKPNKAAGKMGQGIDEEIKERSPVLLEQNMKKQSSDKEQQEEIFLKKDDDSPNNGNHLPFSEVELFRRFSQVKFT